MENIFVILTLISLLGLVIGIVSPEKSLFWIKHNKTRKKSFLIYGTATIVFLLIFGVLSDPSDNSNDKENTVDVVERQHKKEEIDTSNQQKNFGKMLSTLDNEEEDNIKIDNINRLLGAISKQYKEPIDTIAEYTSKAQGVLNNYGIEESNLTILEELKDLNTSKLEGVKFKEIVTIYLMSKTNKVKQ